MSGVETFCWEICLNQGFKHFLEKLVWVRGFETYFSENYLVQGFDIFFGAKCLDQGGWNILSSTLTSFSAAGVRMFSLLNFFLFQSMSKMQYHQPKTKLNNWAKPPEHNQLIPCGNLEVRVKPRLKKYYFFSVIISCQIYCLWNQKPAIKLKFVWW